MVGQVEMTVISLCFLRISYGIRYLYGNHLRWEEMQTGGDEDYEVVPETIGQFTGKKDHTGKDLYENDICTANWPYSKQLVVLWDKTRC